MKPAYYIPAWLVSVIAISMLIPQIDPFFFMVAFGWIFGYMYHIEHEE